LRNHALSAKNERQRKKLIFLVLAWALGLIAVFGLLYQAFLRRTPRASR